MFKNHLRVQILRLYCVVSYCIVLYSQSCFIFVSCAVWYMWGQAGLRILLCAWAGVRCGAFGLRQCLLCLPIAGWPILVGAQSFFSWFGLLCGDKFACGNAHRRVYVWIWIINVLPRSGKHVGYDDELIVMSMCGIVLYGIVLYCIVWYCILL